MATLKEKIQKTDFYKTLTPYLATGLAEGFEKGTQDQIQAAWQYLHDSRLAYQLQGRFGRIATSLIEQGIIGA